MSIQDEKEELPLPPEEIEARILALRNEVRRRLEDTQVDLAFLLLDPSEFELQ